MLVDRFAPEGAFARAPEVAEQTDPVLKAVDSFSGQVQRAKPLIRVFFYLPRSMLFNTIGKVQFGRIELDSPTSPKTIASPIRSGPSIY